MGRENRPQTIEKQQQDTKKCEREKRRQIEREIERTRKKENDREK